MSALHDHAPAAAAITPADRARLGRRAQLFAAASVSYNAVEGVIAIAAGLVAGSVALVGFGLDSAIEVSSGLIILWQFRRRLPQEREQRALRLIAWSFFALAAYVTFESLRALATGAEPDVSPVGIGLALASLTVMPFLAWAQRRTGRALHSTSVVADSNQTLLCTWMSAALLVGLGLNAVAGWGGRPRCRAGHPVSRSGKVVRLGAERVLRTYEGNMEGRGGGRYRKEGEEKGVGGGYKGRKGGEGSGLGKEGGRGGEG
jgi:hypothetical protein